jgi:predicted CXXCH cytochrome family protein
VKKPEPELCYMCHDKEMIASIAGHAAESSTRCTTCHDAHAGSQRGLLKAGRKSDVP